MQPLSSAITGALEAVTPPSSTGIGPGTTASSKSVTVSDDTVRGWLLRQPSPEAADAALARSLTSSCNVTVSPRTESRFPRRGGFYAVPVGYEIEEATTADLPAALARVEQALMPATVEQCEGWLVMLQAATARRSEGEAATAVAYSLYASELRQWPADVARAACQNLARGEGRDGDTNWFPTLAELVAECRRLAAPRKMLVTSLRERIARPSASARPPVSEEERKRIGAELQALVEKMRKPESRPEDGEAAE